MWNYSIQAALLIAQQMVCDYKYNYRGYTKPDFHLVIWDDCQMMFWS